MKHQPHLIHEQVLDLQFFNRAAAESWQAGAGVDFRQRILPLLERYLDELCDPDTLIRLDTLEIDLGDLNPERLGLDLEEKTRRLLKDKLAEAIRREAPPNATATTAAQHRSQKDLFDFFLRTGALPWWANRRDPELLHRCVGQLQTQDAAYWKSRLRAILDSENEFRRLLQYFSDADILEMAKPLAGGWSAFLPDLFRSLEQLAAQFPEAQKPAAQNQRKTLWAGILHTLIEEARDEIELTSRMLLHVATAWGVSVQTLLTEARKGKPTGSAFQRVLPQLMREYREDGQSDVFRKERPTSPEPQPTKDIPAPHDTFSTTGELSIDNAGLVLLWPFLPRFFENLGLVKDKAFVDEAAPHRAVTVLQYLVDGSTQAPEYLLPLNKVLCGLPLEAVHDAEAGRLHASDRERANSFLLAVLQQAAELGKISPEGFRRTFLERSGLLTFEDDHWLLHVERRTFDILLDRIWGFRVLKLPWMAWAMYVDW